MIKLQLVSVPRAVSARRFVGVAAQWTAALLDQVDQERQGVDLFGRDALVLGHVLSCLVRPCHPLPHRTPQRMHDTRAQVWLPSPRLGSLHLDNDCTISYSCEAWRCLGSSRQPGGVPGLYMIMDVHHPTFYRPRLWDKACHPLNSHLRPCACNIPSCAGRCIADAYGCSAWGNSVWIRLADGAVSEDMRRGSDAPVHHHTRAGPLIDTRGMTRPG